MSSLSIAAIVISHRAGDYLARVLSDLGNQSYPLQQVVVVDTASDQDALELAQGHGFSVIQPGDLKLGAAIQAGISALAQRPNWIWILHDDSAPEPQALKNLAKAAEISPSVAVIGPKLLDWEHPIEIQQMGLTTTWSGRPFLQVEREYDQGQHDASADTLAVSTAGMLISLGLWEKLGGIDDATPVFAQDLELGMRARAAGFRVIVEASARVHHAGLSMKGGRSRRWVGGNRRQALSKAHLHLATTVLPLWVVLVLYVALPVLVLASIPANLLAKTPGRSLGQLTGWLWAWGTMPRRVAARSKTRRLGSLAPLRSLLATAEQTKLRRRRNFVVEVEPKDPIKGLFASGSILLALIPLALSLTRFPSGAISSETLAPLGRSLSSVWNSVSAQTLSYLDGVSGVSDPYNWFLGLLASLSPQQPNLALSSFVFAIPALVFISSWLALGIFSGKPWVRSVAAMLLALSPQVQSLASEAAIVEATAVIGLLFATYFLSRATLAFNSARAWRWMALSGFAAAAVATSSPLLFGLLILIAIALSALRPARLAISLWFVLPGIGLLLPWVSAFSVDVLITSAARQVAQPWGMWELIALGVAGVLVAAAFAVGRPVLLSALVLSGAILLLASRLELIFGFKEILVVLLALGAAGLAQLLDGMGPRSSKMLGAIAAAGALASGVVFGPLAANQFEVVSPRQLPALVVAQADVDPGTRTLRIDLGEEIDVDFLWGDGRSQEKISYRYAMNPTDSSFRVLLAQLAGSVLAGNPDGVPQLLSATSTDFVLLTGNAAEVAAARVAITSTALFQESGETEHGLLFRALSASPGENLIDHPDRQWQLGLLAVFLLLALPSIATIRGSRRVRGRQ